MNGGELITQELQRHRVPALFTLCGGHISPILVSAAQRGVQVVDVRHEASAVFAADAVARLSGRPGVAAVTAGPGATNSVTAVKNAQLAQSPVVLLGGAAATMLKGRGALQDIDQMALMRPHVKWCSEPRKVRELPAIVERAFAVAREGVPGPVFVEVPVDLLYDEELVRSWYSAHGGDGKGGGLVERAQRWYLRRHVNRLFAGADDEGAESAAMPPVPPAPPADPGEVRQAAGLLASAERPLLVLGSQATLEADRVQDLARAIEGLGIPVYLAGMARGLLGVDHALQMRHKRRQALREADLVILGGFPCDFRMGYGAHIRRRAALISASRDTAHLRQNRRPKLGVLSDPALFLIALADAAQSQGERWRQWQQALRRRDEERQHEITLQAAEETDYINPLRLCQQIEAVLPDDSVLVADGGDFVATASYIVQPRGPLRWLDPGVFGTLGVGGGFALGAKLCRPQSEVWLLWGDGSAAFSLAEFDSFCRHGLPVIAVVGNDAGWTQIAREQVEILGAETGTALARTAYHTVAEGYGGRGFVVERDDQVPAVLREAQQVARDGKPVLINAQLGATSFRKGSISM